MAARRRRRLDHGLKLHGLPPLRGTLTYVHSTGLIDTKAGYLALMETRALVYLSVVMPQSALDVTGTRAIQHGIFRARIEWHGTATSLDNFFTNVSIKRPDGWKMSLWQSTALPK